jgi:hypothetical protein
MGSINISLAALAFNFIAKAAISMRKFNGVVNRLIPEFVLFFAYKSISAIKVILLPVDN